MDQDKTFFLVVQCGYESSCRAINLTFNGLPRKQLYLNPNLTPTSETRFVIFVFTGASTEPLPQKIISLALIHYLFAARLGRIMIVRKLSQEPVLLRIQLISGIRHFIIGVAKNFKSTKGGFTTQKIFEPESYTSILNKGAMMLPKIKSCFT